MPLQRLEEASTRQLRAGYVISSLAQAVEELVCNSVDAGAKNVKIRLHSCFSCTVDDDGHGIQRDDLKEVGVRHATSKYSDDDRRHGVAPKTLGFKGEALYSLVSCSVVEIVSRHQSSATTYRKLSAGEAATTLGVSSSSRHVGTSVTLRDLFFNQPVRQKLQQDRGKAIKDVQLRINNLAVAFPSIGFSFRDEGEGKHLSNFRRNENLSLRIRQLCGPKCLEDLSEADVRVHDVRLKGLIQTSLAGGQASKSQQYLQVNGRPVLHCFVLDKINMLWKVARQRPAVCGDSTIVRTFPSLFLRINVPQNSYDILHEVNKSRVEFEYGVEANIHRALEEVFGALWKVDFQSCAFLKTSHSSLQPTRKGAISNSKTSQLVYSGSKGCPSSLKPSNPHSPNVYLKQTPSTPHRLRHQDTGQNTLYEGISAQKSAGKESACDDRPRTSAYVNPYSSNREYVSKKAHYYAHSAKTSSSGHKPNYRDPTCLGLPKKDKIHSKSLVGQLDFTIGSTEVKSMSRTGDKGACRDSALPIHCAQQAVQKSSYLGLSRDDLASAKIMTQVHNQFIILQSGTMIIAIDQHAADERVRLEELRAEYIEQRCLEPQKLPKPQALQLSPDDLALLKNRRKECERWGWRWTPKYLTHAACIKDTQLSVTDLQKYLSQLASEDHRIHVPTSLLRLLESKACRSAIMFGDRLLKQETKMLVSALSSTKLYMQCAHGRPTFSKVYDYETLASMYHKKRKNLGEESLRKRARRLTGIL